MHLPSPHQPRAAAHGVCPPLPGGQRGREAHSAHHGGRHTAQQLARRRRQPLPGQPAPPPCALCFVLADVAVMAMDGPCVQGEGDALSPPHMRSPRSRPGQQEEDDDDDDDSEMRALDRPAVMDLPSYISAIHTQPRTVTGQTPRQTGCWSVSCLSVYLWGSSPLPEPPCCCYCRPVSAPLVELDPSVLGPHPTQPTAPRPRRGPTPATGPQQQQPR